jgi:hypothetical protein
MDMLIEALSKGKLCVVDVSQMRGRQALVLSGLILRRIFDRNQEQFTSAEPSTIPTIAVIEEAQAVLQENAASAEPYIAWVKEGRKYDLGAVLVTQQPGSIPTEILSQGDNWFIFHLLSAADLANVKRANAHFSEDLLSSLLNEPIPGQGVFWSSVGGKPYPIPLRALSFEKAHPLQDPHYSRPGAPTFAADLVKQFESTAKPQRAEAASANHPIEALGGIFGSEDFGIEGVDTPPDAMEFIEHSAIEALKSDPLIEKLKTDGVAWGTLKAFLLARLPTTLDDRDKFAFELVPKALTRLIGNRDEAWHSYKQTNREGSSITYVRAGKKT